MVLGFGVIGALLWYAGPDPNTLSYQAVKPQKTAIGLWLVGVLLCAVSFGPRAIARPVYVAWMSAAMFMGMIMTFLVLSVLFIILLPWFSFIRLADPLGIKPKPDGESYWRDHVDQEPVLERVARPF